MLYFRPIEGALFGAVATQKRGYSTLLLVALAEANLGHFAFLLFMVTGIFHLPRAELVHFVQKA
jgi:hypothetical protein